MRENKTQKRITVFLGIFLAFAMGASLILPMLTTNIQAPLPEDVPAPTVAPTLPPPITDLSNIRFDERFLHQSGLYSAAVPTGWRVLNQVTSSNEAQATLQNAEQLSVVELRVIQPLTPVEDGASLADIFDTTWLSASWREYTSWTEDTRSVDEDSLTMNFTLGRGAQQFIARQVATTDGEWVYVTRVVAPPNASAMLQHVLNEVSQTFQPNKQFINTPFDWSGYQDGVHGHFIRYPRTWGVTDDAQGGVTTIQSDTNGILRLETDAVQMNTEDEARSWVEAWRSGVNVLSILPTDQFGFTGFRIAYELETIDGTAQSGLVLMLNDGEGTLHVANLRFDVLGLDFNQEVPDQFTNDVAMLDTFTVSFES